MHKVILVDHEEGIRHQLQETVDWERHGFEVIGEAGNGREALLLHDELRPDLIVVEISIPVMDGLQVMEEIRKTDSDCHIVILSRLSDFYYAKTAISLGVTSYLLKPAEGIEIEKELMRIGKRMQKKSDFEVAVLQKKELLYWGGRGNNDNRANMMRQEAPDIGTLSDKLCYAIDIGNRSLLCRVLEEGLNSIAQYDGAEQAVKTATSQWISLTLTKLSKTNEIAYVVVQDALSVISHIYEQPDYKTLQRMLEDRLMLLLDRIGSDCRESVIKQVLDFVERHYDENLKLETLGELFHYNSGYLGRLFRNATGDAFRTYLDKVRIRNAKIFLESGLKVHQVASRVGISNVDYFNRKFKKYIGEKPSLYKRKTVSFQGEIAQNE
ncbi:response regulator [Paenibacillus sp. sptzw28]|uniref:response regulator transcription factor n=1 Tax=Paenibacillus sp. sptzw28 TaxID=715179 RepID=UPI001C6F457E|nr:response regulator [Paenibacillus sp. sptzw28]QYR23093.1 response regulator [Paenibacillus sp. sptzw28]